MKVKQDDNKMKKETNYWGRNTVLWEDIHNREREAFSKSFLSTSILRSVLLNAYRMPSFIDLQIKIFFCQRDYNMGRRGKDDDCGDYYEYFHDRLE